MTDSLFNGHRFRSLTIVDNFSRECLSIEVGQHIKGEDVVGVVERIKAMRGTPNFIKVDNGPEFISKELDKWAYENKVTLDFSRPGKPTDNAYIESFNGSFRDECLISIGFCRWMMPGRRLKNGAGIIMTGDRIALLTT